MNQQGKGIDIQLLVNEYESTIATLMFENIRLKTMVKQMQQTPSPPPEMVNE